MGNAAKIALSIVGVTLLAIVVAFATGKEENAPLQPIITVISARDADQIDRLSAQGRYADAQKVLLGAIQVGPEPPRIGEACRREFINDYLVLDCIQKMVKRRHYEDELHGLDRVYRNSH